MVFNHYRFHIAFNIPSHLTMIGIPLILDIVVYPCFGNLMGGLI